MAGYGYLHDVESGGGLLLDDKAGPDIAYAEAAVRQGFVRKVFGLLSAQLAITAAVTAAFLFSPGVQRWTYSNPWTLWAAFGASLVLILVLSCSESARRSHPTNLLLLFAFTAAEALLVATASATYDTDVVLLAAGLTAAITLGLTAYAMQTKRDFTASGGLLVTLLLALLGAGLLSALLPASKGLTIAVSALGAGLFGAYIVFDVQLMLGGGSYAIGADEYVFASLTIYLDVVNLFLYLLRLLQEIQGDNN